METKKSIITELNLQQDMFLDMYVFTIAFENGDIGKMYKKKKDIYEKVGQEMEYTIDHKNKVKAVFKGESKFNDNNNKPSYSNNNNDAKDDIRFSVAFKGAIELASAGKIGIDEVEKFTVMYDDFLKDKKSVEMPF
jgi:hypothetical protein|tara:strand:- start:681 stop:1088 length:408 start_codon:yes stop_codon:yes gene_type:complete